MSHKLSERKEIIWKVDKGSWNRAAHALFNKIGVLWRMLEIFGERIFLAHSCVCFPRTIILLFFTREIVFNFFFPLNQLINFYFFDVIFVVHDFFTTNRTRYKIWTNNFFPVRRILSLSFSYACRCRRLSERCLKINKNKNCLKWKFPYLLSLH